MEKEQISIEKLKEAKEKEPKEISRYEIEPQKNISVVIRILKNIRVSEPWDELKHGSLQVVLQKDNKDVFDFNELLPRGYKIVSLDPEMEKELRRDGVSVWECDEDKKFVISPLLWDEDSKDTLSLLHEIGHSRDRKTRRKEKELEAELKAGQGEDFVKKFMKLQGKAERSCWAYALSIVRKIKREKQIDLLTPFRGKTIEATRKNLEKYIHGQQALGHAEKTVKSVLAKIGSKGVFTTKYYKGEKFTPEHRKKIRGK